MESLANTTGPADVNPTFSYGTILPAITLRSVSELSIELLNSRNIVTLISVR